MNPKMCRLMTTVLFFVLLICCLSVTVYADDGDAQASISKMNDKIMYWYYLIRNYIAVPLTIISFASCGFRMVGSIFSSSPNAMDSIKTQIKVTAIAFAVLTFLPLIIGEAREMLESTAWQPPD